MVLHSAIFEVTYDLLEAKTRSGKMARGLWYHGTDPKHLKSILAQGLKVSAKKNWDSDPDASRIQIDRTAYGGIYVSKNLMTAMSASTTGGGKGRKTGTLVVAMELQPRSMVADEDDLAIHLSELRFGGMTWNSTAAARLWFGLQNMDVPDEYDPQYMTREEVRDVHRKQENKRMVLEYWEDYQERFYRMYEARFDGAKPNAAKKKAAEPHLRMAFEGAIERMAGYFADEHGKWWMSDWHREYGDRIDPKAKREDLPEPPSAKEGEAKMRRGIDRLTKILKDSVTAPNKFSTSARSLLDIKFSGANKIIAIAEANTHIGLGTKTIKIHYGTLPADFFEQWSYRWGSKMYVVDAQGNRLPQYDKYKDVVQELDTVKESKTYESFEQKVIDSINAWKDTLDDDEKDESLVRTTINLLMKPQAREFIEKAQEALSRDHRRKTITVYRGGVGVTKDALSGWSTDPHVAAFFAGRRGGDYRPESSGSEICRATVSKKYVLYYDKMFKKRIKNGHESEVLLAPGNDLKIIKCINTDNLFDRQRFWEDPDITAEESDRIVRAVNEGIDAHRQGSTIWIDLMELPKDQRGKGLGRKEYEAWEAKLPKDIKLVKLMASDMGDGNSEGFWDAMGFDFVYTADDLVDIPYEQRQEMQKGVNGHRTPKPTYWDED